MQALTTRSNTGLTLRGLAAFIVAGLLCAIAGVTPVQAEPGAARATATGDERCSLWSASIPGLRYRDCLISRMAGSGSYEVRTGLQVINATRTDRWVQDFQRTIINGRVVSVTGCRIKVHPGNGAVATCWNPPGGRQYLTVFPKGYAYGIGTVADLSSGRSGTAASPLLDLRNP
jgi:hypothetical protein